MRHASRKIGVWSSRFTGCWFCVVGRRAEAGLPGFPCRSFVPAVRRLSSVTEVPAANLIVSAVGATRRRLFWWKRGLGLSGAPLCRLRGGAVGRFRCLAPVRRPVLVPVSCSGSGALFRSRAQSQSRCLVPVPAPGPNPGVLFRPRSAPDDGYTPPAPACNVDGRRPPTRGVGDGGRGSLGLSRASGCYSHALSDMSSDLIWWVSAPTEMKSTPHSA